MTNRISYVVIGSSAAGLAAIKKIRQLDPLGSVYCISDEKELPYNKCFLADMISRHKTDQEVYTATESFFKKHNVTFLSSTCIVSIDSHLRLLNTQDGRVIAYEKLLLAVGGRARVLPLAQGIQGCFSFYTLADAYALDTYISEKKPCKAVVVGAGLTGLELADALVVRGMQVTVLEAAARILQRQADQKTTDLITSTALSHNVVIKVATAVTAFTTDTDGAVTAVECSDGSVLNTQLVVLALGSEAQLELAHTANLFCKDGAFVTSDTLQTSDPHIWAAGDVALVKHALTGKQLRTVTWPDAVQQGMYAGAAMAGQAKLYGGVVPFSTSQFFGKTFVYGGIVEAETEQDVIVINDSDAGYQKVILSDDRVVKGFVLYSTDSQNAVTYKRSLFQQTPVAE